MARSCSALDNAVAGDFQVSNSVCIASRDSLRYCCRHDGRVLIALQADIEGRRDRSRQMSRTGENHLFPGLNEQ